MKYIEFDNSKKYDLILLGRVAVDLNPVDYYCPLNESTTFKRYLGGSPANIAVGLARLGKKCGFFARVSDDQLGTFVTDYFVKEGSDVSHIVRCKNGEKIGLTFTEIKSETESSIVMYRNMAADLKLDVEDIDESYIRQAKADNKKARAQRVLFAVYVGSVISSGLPRSLRRSCLQCVRIR